MNLDHLQTLMNIVEHGSLSAAARAMRVSQPAVTKQLQRLEVELGATLLARGPRRQAELTPAGERVMAFARETMAAFEGMMQELAVIEVTAGGVLAVAASTIPGEYLMPGLMAAFRQVHPAIKVEMTVADSSEVVDRLLADEVDVGVIGTIVQRPGLRLERLVGDEIVLVVPPDHAFAGRQVVTVEELVGQQMVQREAGSGTRRSVESALAAAGYNNVGWTEMLVLGSSQAVLQAVQQGLGIGFVSARAAADAVAAGRVAYTGIAGVDLHRALYLVYLPHRIGDPLLARFLEFVRAQYGEVECHSRGLSSQVA
ncbi:MAG: LysR family transcriptional regulator [Anaerolineae bacterium]|nr:LysR family transcriptional regulator [Anaerolineae bacterium]